MVKWSVGIGRARLRVPRGSAGHAVPLDRVAAAASSVPPVEAVLRHPEHAFDERGEAGVLLPTLVAGAHLQRAVRAEHEALGPAFTLRHGAPAARPGDGQGAP